MNMTSTAIRINPEIRSEAQAAADELGLSLSGVMNKLLKYFVRKKTIDFVYEDEIPNARTHRLLKQAEKDLRDGKASPVFNSAKEMIDWLHAQGV